MLLPLHSGAPEIRCILDEGMLLAVRIPLISDHDRFVARLFRVQVNFKGVTAVDFVAGLAGLALADRRFKDCLGSSRRSWEPPKLRLTDWHIARTRVHRGAVGALPAYSQPIKPATGNTQQSSAVITVVVRLVGGPADGLVFVVPQRNLSKFFGVSYPILR
jgi:hypothetical protein